ncbi:peptide chain release factor N(5)-glutamine methyltransferase [Candidatus Uhrbacteria bacterium]|nr:peptide chain release factor N(5)-glutamine methyltransferase [Candidatus Uhrbacteria bacterium]
MTILAALQNASHALTRSASAQLDAQVLLGFAMQKPTAWLFTHSDWEVGRAEPLFNDLLNRRGNGEPIAYLTGEKEFFGRPFAVTKDVLIPRPDTETLVERAIALSDSTTMFMDIGTGSGAIAVTLAAETGHPVTAIDASPEALDIARQNAAVNGVADRISFFESNLLESHFPVQTPNLGVSARIILCANLPYLTSRQMAEAPPELRYEPYQALWGGEDGLDWYWLLLRQIRRQRTSLPHTLTCLLEIDPDQAEPIQRLARTILPGAQVFILDDLSQQARVVEMRV